MQLNDLQYAQLPGHMRRVYTERQELYARLSLLQNFIASGRYWQLPWEERKLLSKQRNAMQDYYNILDARLELYLMPDE